MKLIYCTALAAAVILAGCSHKANARTELERAADVLAQTDKAQPTAGPALATGAQIAPAPRGSASAEPAAAPAPGAAQQMQQALASYKAGQMEDAVIRLQKLRAMPTLTGQQRMAVQDGVAAVMNEIYELAAKGDTRAIAAVRQYELMQRAPRQ